MDIIDKNEAMKWLERRENVEQNEKKEFIYFS